MKVTNSPVSDSLTIKVFKKSKAYKNLLKKFNNILSEVSFEQAEKEIELNVFFDVDRQKVKIEPLLYESLIYLYDRQIITGWMSL